MNHEVVPKEVDLSTSELKSKALKFVLDYIHNGHDSDPLRLEVARDFAAVWSLLHAADYCGALNCKSWAEKVLIEKHISGLKPQDLRCLTEDARARHARHLYEAAGKQLAQRAPVDILRDTSCDVLAELIDRHLPKRTSRVQEMAVTSQSNKFMILDSATGTIIKTLEERTDEITSIAYSFDGTLIASCSEDKTIKLWNADTYDCFHLIENAHAGRIDELAFSRRNRLASVSEDAKCKIWHTSTGAFLQEQEYDNFACAVAFSPNNVSQLASGHVNGTVRVWQTDTDNEPDTLEGHRGRVNAVVYRPDCILASGSDDGMIRLWDSVTLDCLRTLESAADAIRCICFAPDNNSLAAVTFDGICADWRLVTGNRRKNWRYDAVGCKSSNRIFPLSYTPDDCAIVSSIAHGIRDDDSWSLGFWDPSIEACVRTIPTGSDEIVQIAFRPPPSSLA